MASTGRSSQGSGAGSRAGAAGARGASSARGSQASGRGAAGSSGSSAREASLNASATASGGPGGINVGGSAGVSGGPAGVSGSAGLSGSTGSAGSTGTTGTAGLGASAGGTGAESQGQGMAGQAGAGRMDAEREVPIGRERQTQSRAAGRGQGGAQSSAQSGSQSGMQGGVQGGAQGGAQGYGTPFAFMRRFGEEMDRLFSDFGFGPPGIESQLSLLGWPGSSGRSSLSLNANIPRGGASSEGRGEASGSPGSAMSRPRSSSALASRRGWMPQVEVLQRGNDLVLRADLPGLRREDVHVEIDDGVLTISGERRYETESEEEGLYHSERSYGQFSRSIPLPPGTDGDASQARFTDGVLEVTVPLPQDQSRARRIEIR